MTNTILKPKETSENSVPERIPIFIPDEEAKKFLIFQEYYEPINILIESKVFEQLNATILLDIDREGVIRSIRRQDYLYTLRT